MQRPLTFNTNNFNRDYLILFLIYIISLFLDLIWIHFHELPPAWDQGSHLSTAFQISHLFDSFDIFNSNWWTFLWSKTPTYRGPLTYLLSVPFFKIFGESYKIAIISNQLFNLILIISSYFLGRIIYSRNSGLWASLFCASSPIFLSQRTDYLIDLSLASMVTLSWLLLIIWRRKLLLNQWLTSFCVGILFGLVFLTRPTGLIFLFLPFLLIFFEISLSRSRKRNHYLAQIVLIIATTISLALPWFSQNWLTIITSINKARKWGILYQDGLESDTLGAWLYYPKLLPIIFGPLLLGLLLSGFILFIFQRYYSSNKKKINLKNIKSYLFYLSFPLGGFLICILMTTKDIRFILPLIPQLFIFFGIIIELINNNWSAIWKRSLIFVSLLSLCISQFGFGLNLNGLTYNKPIRSEGWPLESIVSSITTKSPYQISTLAVLSDARNFNAFNIDAEGQRKDNLLFARQLYYESDDLSTDLSNFDWFIFKTGDQGIMSGEKELLLSKLIKSSEAFALYNQWILPDGSYAYLFKRKSLSVKITKIDCSQDLPQYSANSIPGGLKIVVKDKASKLINSHLLIDLDNNSIPLIADQAIARGMMKVSRFDQSSCFMVQQELLSNKILNSSTKNFAIKIRLIENNNIKGIDLPNEFIKFNNTSYIKGSLAVNRIEELSIMGNKLKEGNIENLFAKVGQINQGDPEQIYLKNAEVIFKTRLSRKPNDLDNLYGLALSQTLQKKAKEASLTFQKICLLDSANKIPFIAKGFVDLYSFQPKSALTSLNKAESLNSDPELIDTIHILKLIATIFKFDIYKFFSLI